MGLEKWVLLGVGFGPAFGAFEGGGGGLGVEGASAVEDLLDGEDLDFGEVADSSSSAIGYGQCLPLALTSKPRQTNQCNELVITVKYRFASSASLVRCISVRVMTVLPF